MAKYSLETFNFSALCLFAPLLSNHLPRKGLPFVLNPCKKLGVTLGDGHWTKSQKEKEFSVQLILHKAKKAEKEKTPNNIFITKVVTISTNAPTTTYNPPTSCSPRKIFSSIR